MTCGNATSIILKRQNRYAFVTVECLHFETHGVKYPSIRKVCDGGKRSVRRVSQIVRQDFHFERRASNQRSFDRYYRADINLRLWRNPGIRQIDTEGYQVGLFRGGYFLWRSPDNRAENKIFRGGGIEGSVECAFLCRGERSFEMAKKLRASVS